MMTCRKCEIRINTGTKCFQCGYDVSKGPIQNSKATAKNKRSPMLIGITGLFIIFSVIMITANLGVIFRIPVLANMTILLTFITGISNNIFFITLPGMNGVASGVIGAAVGVFQIILCVGILRLQRRAFNIYVGLTAAQAIMQVLGLLLILIFNPMGIVGILWPYILKGALLLVIYKTDSKHFGGGKISEPVSVIRARQRREREAREI